MLKFLLLPAIVVSFVSIARAETVYSIGSWPADLDKVPCDAWKKNADGSWTQTGTIKAGRVTMSGNTFGNTAESTLVEKKCGSN
jgi:hypothetical protein